eukprot:2024183-Alexandrium_andersonii.AAC.1
MSASLVGSEMCIRDRYPSPPQQPRPTRGEPPERTEAEGRRQPLHTQGAVSYTHLTLPTICSV